MANGYYGDKAVTLPNMFQSFGQALAGRIDDTNRSNERQIELDYRAKKEAEQDEWKKLNLIQELTDISKYQTGSDVADAIGNKKMSEIYQKYTQSAANMSPTELQANVQKDMFGIINGMNAAKEELNQADEQLKLLKQKHPSLDIARMATDYRTEILGRRVKDNEFVNPLTVGQSQFESLNPDFLSKYITGNSNLTKTIQTPQGSETMKVFKGSPSAYTEYTAKLNPWKKESFDREKLKGGFMGSGEPKLEIRGRSIPGIKAVDGKEFMAIDEDVYDRFAQDETMNLELTAATRQKFKDYDNFSPEEKSLAKRNVLYDKISELDKSDYYPSDVKSPPRISVRTSGGSGSQGGSLNLSNYPAVGDEYDVTKLMQGINVVNKGGVKNLTASKVLYNPDTKTITFTDIAGDTETVDFDTFRQNIATINTGVDLRQVDRLGNSQRRNEKDVQKTKPQPKKDPLNLGL